jgi:hypothetical protein
VLLACMLIEGVVLVLRIHAGRTTLHVFVLA